MKNLVASLMFTVFATGALATSVDRTPVIARADGYYQGLRTVALLTDGRLQIINEDGLVKTVHLSTKAFEKIYRDLSKVANVEIIEVHNQPVCMTFAAVIPDTLSQLSVVGFDYQTSSFNSELRLVLSERGCHVQDMTFPKEVYAQSDAATVRAELVILALANLK